MKKSKLKKDILEYLKLENSIKNCYDKNERSLLTQRTYDLLEKRIHRYEMHIDFDMLVASLASKFKNAAYHYLDEDDMVAYVIDGGSVAIRIFDLSTTELPMLVENSIIDIGQFPMSLSMCLETHSTIAHKLIDAIIDSAFYTRIRDMQDIHFKAFENSYQKEGMSLVDYSKKCQESLAKNKENPDEIWFDKYY